MKVSMEFTEAELEVLYWALFHYEAKHSIRRRQLTGRLWERVRLKLESMENTLDLRKYRGGRDALQ